MLKHSTPTQRVEYGLDTIPADRMVTVSLRDLMYAHQAFAEFVNFFHQPLHYRDLAAVQRFLGSRGSGDAIALLWESYYKRMHGMIPADIDQAFADGERFNHPCHRVIMIQATATQPNQCAGKTNTTIDQIT